MLGSVLTHDCFSFFQLIKIYVDNNITSNNKINFNIVFSNNHNYTSVLFGTLLNSCYWQNDCAFKNASPGEVCRRAIRYDAKKYIIARREPTFCYCDKLQVKLTALKMTLYSHQYILDRKFLSI